MLKNRFFSIFAVAAMVSLAACGGGEEGAEATTEETTPAADATAPTMEPAAPMTTDTMAMAPATTDTMAMGGTTAPMTMDTAAGATTPPTQP
jgi:ABC-type oligopeptide transport system substrate-binding subunit